MRKAFLLLISIFPLVLKAQPLVIAHRGASACKPENTISSFAEAIRMNVDYIETDVHQTKDGIVVVMHDFSVNRTCDNKNRISKIRDLDFSEFSSLTIRNSKEQPPSLDSAIKFINGRCKLLIEIKKGSDYYPGIESKVLEIIKSNHAGNWVDIIHSFDKRALLNLQKQKSGARLQKLVVFKFPLASFTFTKRTENDNFAAWQGVNIYERFASRRIIKKLHAQNKTVFVWTVNSKRKMKKMIRRGVDGIITNKPDELIALLKEARVPTIPVK